MKWEECDDYGALFHEAGHAQHYAHVDPGDAQPRQDERLQRIVAEHANIWHGFGGAQTIAHKHEVLDEWCRKAGRDPAEIERSVGVPDGSGKRDQRPSLPGGPRRRVRKAGPTTRSLRDRSGGRARVGRRRTRYNRSRAFLARARG